MRKRHFRAPKMQVFYKRPRVQILENITRIKFQIEVLQTEKVDCEKLLQGY